mgnify:CR=1 FL=1
MENKRRIISVLCFIIWCYFSIKWSGTGTSQSITNSNEVFSPIGGKDNIISPLEEKTSNSLSSCVYSTAAKEIGVTEQGGENRGKRVGEYLAVTGLPEGYAWCAAFVSWTLKQCGIKVPYSARAHDMSTYNIIYKKNRKGRIPKTAKGKILVFGVYTFSNKTYNHTGFIPDIRKAAAITTEGNTNGKGEREGDVVATLIRPLATIDVISDYAKY